MPLDRFALRGGYTLDMATGERRRGDVDVVDGRVVPSGDHNDLVEIDATDLTICFGLWDCHTHPGGLMYDPRGVGYFEGVAERTIRAQANLQEALAMGITGVRAVGDASGLDIALARAFRTGVTQGPRLFASGRALSTTGGHGTAYPRSYLNVEERLVVDGPVEVRRAVRTLVEHGADWVKLLLTGGLYSEHETVDGGQFDEEEFHVAMATAAARGLPVSAHCGSASWAVAFAEAGGKSVEHGYALDEHAAQAMARAETWLVPTLSVTHDVEMMRETQWPEHAMNRALETARGHAEALQACRAAGVPIATGADLNPIGPRLHAELRILEAAGMDRLEVLRAATVGGRQLMGLGDESVPVPGSIADLVLLESDPLEDMETLRSPAGVAVFGRLVIDPGGIRSQAGAHELVRPS
jgi:imidazolonepropionase-like amidohydrolase